MKVLYHINQKNFNSAQKWIFESWKSGFEIMNCQVETATSYNLENKINNYKPDILLTDICMIRSKYEFEIISAATSRGIKTAMWVHWPLEKNFTHLNYVFQTKDKISLFFGEREGIEEQFQKDTGMEYVCIANSASDDTHYLGNYQKSLETDVLYVGTKLYKKKWFEKNILEHLKKRKNLKVKIIGLGWEKKDFIIRLFKKIFAKLFLHSAVRFISKYSIKISSEVERNMYASAKICLNFHEIETDGSQPHHIVNQRTFKIPACGGFQIVDKVNAMEKYFKDGVEIVSANLSQKEWLQKIDYYLDNPSERNKIRINGYKRAIKDHYASNRVKILFQKLGLKKNVYNKHHNNFI